MENQTPLLVPEETETSVIKKKKSFKVELVLFLVLGFLLGIVIKTEASKRIVIGFNDHKVAALNRGYDLNQIQKDLNEKAQKEQEEARAAGGVPSDAPNGGGAAPIGGTCGG